MKQSIIKFFALDMSKGPFTPESRSTAALSRTGKIDGSAMSGP